MSKETLNFNPALTLLEKEKPVSLPEGVAEITRKKLIDSGLFYIVPPGKYQFYENGSPQMVKISPEAAVFFQPFLASEKPEIGVDLESLVEQVVSPQEIHLNQQNIKTVESGLKALENLIINLSSKDEWLSFITGILSEKDKAGLELGFPKNGRPLVSPGTIIRADLLTTEDGRPLICDPNYIPVGYPITKMFTQGIEEATGLPLRPRPDYESGLIVMAQEKPGQVSGILTSLKYPNWPSHVILAQEISRQSGTPFYCLPVDCFDERTGLVDISALRKFNQALEIDNRFLPREDFQIPGVVIRYSRENKIFHPETKVVNPPGTRILETQVWPALVSLPGFTEFAREAGISDQELELVKANFIPSILVKIKDGEPLVATMIFRSPEGNIALKWESLSENLGILERLFAQSGSTEKSNEICWFIKTASTSGKKGVRFTSDGRIDQASKNISKQALKMGLTEVFVVQPKIRSTINLAGEEQRTKIDFFVSANSGEMVALDFMATPINQRSAHGGSATKLGLVAINK